MVEVCFSKAGNDRRRIEGHASMAGVASARFSRSGRLIWANPAFRKAFGAPEGAVIAELLAAVLESAGAGGSDDAPPVLHRLDAGEWVVVERGDRSRLGLSLADGDDGERLLTVAVVSVAGTGGPRPQSHTDAAQTQMLDAIGVPLVVTRLSDAVVLSGNRPASELFGIDLEEAAGRIVAWDIYVDPDDRRRMLKHLRTGGGRIDGFETRLRIAGDRIAWTLIAVRRFRFQGEDAILSCIADITERKGMEQDLEAQWAQSRAVLDGLAQGVMAFDRDLRLIAWNQRVLDLLEVPADFAHFRQPLIEITRHVAERGGYGPGDVAQIVRDRLAYVSGLGNAVLRRNERMRADGLIMETVTQALPDGGFVTTYTDITERRRAERELAESRELFELAIRAARDGISQWDLTDGSVWFSPQWWSLLGYGGNDMANSLQRWSELVLPEDREPWLQLINDYAAGRVDDCQTLQRFRHRAGHLVTLFTRAVKVIDADGRAVRLVGSHTDMTERIRAEEAERAAKEQAEQALKELKDTQSHLIQSEKMAALGSMVAGVAHEINTPIGNALAGASLLSDRTRNIREVFNAGRLRKPEFADYVETAQEVSQLLLLNIHRAAELIQSFKQMAVDQASGERRVFEMRGYINEVLHSLSARMRRAAHTLEVECPPDLLVDGYPGALSQVLTNFIMNSLTHAYRPGERGRLRIAVSQPVPGEVEVVFADNGRGIPRELHEKVFEPFFTTNRGGGGTGLGLNIVYTIVTRTLRGRITLDSEPGWGTRFTLRFPRVLPDGEAVRDS